MPSLATRACEPCTKDMPALPQEEARALLTQLPEWELQPEGRAISRRFTFKNFRKALAFVNAVGELAEAEFHHPDIKLGWGYAEITFTTHSINGLHMNDFILAARVDGLSQAQ